MIYTSNIIRKPINKATASAMNWREKDRELQTKVETYIPRLKICPICNVELNSRNLDRHITKVHSSSLQAAEINLTLLRKMKSNAEKEHHLQEIAERKKEKEAKKKQCALQLEQKIREKKDRLNNLLAQSKSESPEDLIDQKVNVSKTTGFVEKNGKLISVTKIKVKKPTQN